MSCRDHYTSSCILQAACGANRCSKGRKRKDRRSRQRDSENLTNPHPIHPKREINNLTPRPNNYLKRARITHCLNREIECNYFKRHWGETRSTLFWYSQSTHSRSANICRTLKVSVLSWKTICGFNRETYQNETWINGCCGETWNHDSENKRRQEWTNC